MNSFPGPRPVVGDAVEITTGSSSVTINGSITSQGILRDGCGFVELTLPDPDPQQRRDLEWSKQFQYDLFLSGVLLSSSPQLRVQEFRRDRDGVLVVAGSP